MKIFFLGLLLTMNSIIGQGASFPCGKATTKVERLICSDPRLSAIDEEMADRYREALANTNNPARVKREQRDWLNGDRNTCKSDKCLLIAYAIRLDALGSESTTASNSSYQGTVGSDEVALIQRGGVYEVPVVVNDVLKINFILDSGASDVSISPDVALTLLKTGTISQADWLPGAVYSFADGSSAKSARFKIRSMKVGNRILRDVTCGIAKNIEAPMLLGQSALHKLGSYQIDYRRGALILR